MLSKFNYSLLHNSNNDYVKMDEFVRNNDQLIDKNANYYDNLAMNVSDHVKHLNKIHKIT